MASRDHSDDRRTSQLASVSVEELVDRSVHSSDPIEQMNARPTTKMRANDLLDLLDQVAPEDGVIDLHAITPVPEPTAPPVRNKHVARRASSACERTTAMMPPLTPQAYGVEEPAPASVGTEEPARASYVAAEPARAASRVWLIAAAACVALASCAVFALS